MRAFPQQYRPHLEKYIHYDSTLIAPPTPKTAGTRPRERMAVSKQFVPFNAGALVVSAALYNNYEKIKNSGLSPER